MSHRKPRQYLRNGITIRTAAALALAAGASASVLAEDGHAANQPTAPRVRAEVARLYQRAEQVTQRYDGVQAQASATRHQLALLQDQLARRTQTMNLARDRLGSLAAARYRAGGIDPAARLLLSNRPEHYLEGVTLLERAGRARAATMRGLVAERQRAQTVRDQAAGRLTALAADQRELAADRHTIEQSLARARHLLARLAPAQRAAVAADDLTGAGPAGATGHVLGALVPHGVRAPSSRAAAAVAFAYAQIGKPYSWGATGPHAYDCSGLAQAAWASAGVRLPRTTYTQIKAGRRVPRNRLKPGDLVFFYSGISHVGIYVGGGRMIHAPHPGAPVRTAPVDEMPFAGATRPA